jgi:hypothetical protein
MIERGKKKLNFSMFSDHKKSSTIDPPIKIEKIMASKAA